MAPRRVAAVALAVVLGVALAVLLAPAGPTDAEVAPAPAARPSSPRKTARTPAPAATTAPSEEALPRIHQSETHPPPANLAGLAEARKKDPVARHAEIDAPKWASMAGTLSEYGYPALAASASAMAEDLGQIKGSRDEGARDLFEEERRLTVEIRQSGALPLVKDTLGPVEEGLNAAQQGGIHPADMPPPPADPGSR